MAEKAKDQKFSKRETQQRFEAALRGARVTGPKHRDDRKRKKTARPKKGN